MAEVNLINGGDSWDFTGARTRADRLMWITVHGNRSAILGHRMPLSSAGQLETAKTRNIVRFFDALCRVVLLAWIVLSALIVVLALGQASTPPQPRHAPYGSSVVVLGGANLFHHSSSSVGFPGRSHV